MTAETRQALNILDHDGVVGFPTETVYGLAARIDRREGLLGIFRTKERPFFDPLIVHVADARQAESLALIWPDAARALTDAFWPGPLTLVVPKKAQVDSLITSGLETVGLRCPDHPLALELIRAAGPLAAPSANRFGRTSPTEAEHVRREFGGSVFTLDGGPCRVGIESTILSLETDGDTAVLRFLRKGAVTPSAVATTLFARGLKFRIEESTERRLAPGQMKHHYMPDIPLVLADPSWSADAVLAAANADLASLPDEVEGVKLRKPTRPLAHPVEIDLGDDPTVAARRLYAELRDAAKAPADLLYLRIKPSMTGEAWDGLLDRLGKAASLRLPTRP